VNIMKILVTSIIDLKKSAHNRPHEFISYLQKKHDVTVLCPNDWWKASKTNTEAYTKGHGDSLDNVKIRYFSNKRISPAFQELSLFASIGKILKEIDYRSFDIHFNYNSLIAGYHVTKRMKSAGIKTVLDIADNLPAMVRESQQIPKFLRPAAGELGKTLLLRNIKNSDFVTVTLDSFRNLVNKPLVKSAVIPNGVDIHKFKPFSVWNVRKELGLEKSVIIGYVGVLREWIDLEPLFAGTNQLISEGLNLKLLIVGDEGGLSANKNLAATYGLSRQSFFTGTVPYTLVPELMNLMDICVIPFKKGVIAQNALPLKLFEYMACEKPVISSPTSGIQRIAGERVFYASDAREIKQKISMLYNNSELRKKAGSEGRKLVERNYSWDPICSKLEDYLRDFCPSKGTIFGGQPFNEPLFSLSETEDRYLMGTKVGNNG
jgi:glycosyltransferase involved in cell wall biosynthesis